MALINESNYLSTSQLVVLGWGKQGSRAAHHRLKLLSDNGYLERFRPVSGVGSAEWIYRLSADGWNALIGSGTLPSGGRYTPGVLTSISYTEHDLQIAAIVIHIALAAAQRGANALLPKMPFRWRGPRAGRNDTSPIQDPGVVRDPLPDGTRLHPEQSRLGYLEPDAILVADAGPEARAVLIEYDRTQFPHKQIDRLRRYDRWLLNSWRQSAFAGHPIPPSVVFITEREKPLRTLIATADTTLTAWHGHEHAGPREGTYPARQRMVFTSRDRILNGDWTMQRTPSLPPPLRDDDGCLQPRSIKYNLASLLAVS